MKSALALSLLLWTGKADLVAEAEVDRGEDSPFLVAASTTPEVPPACSSIFNRSLELTMLEQTWLDQPEAEIVSSTHTEKNGAVVTYDQIPRRWDRPVDYDAYQYPVARFLGWPAVVSGYDLDQPDDKQRRGTMRAVGHGGVDLPQTMGAPINMVPLAHQIGDAEVVYVGPLFGNTVVTLHTVREGGEHRHYVLLFGHLSEPAPKLAPRSVVRAGDLVGLVGDSESPNLVHLHLEARRVRDGVDPTRLTPDAVLTRTIVTDPRNVLPLRPRPATSALAQCKERLIENQRSLGDWRLDRPTATWLSMP
jgi:murein DD-endopeptidase MepM/ murein hydrolase activator NlpD